jgi:hypothetical protein
MHLNGAIGVETTRPRRPGIAESIRFTAPVTSCFICDTGVKRAETPNPDSRGPAWGEWVGWGLLLCPIYDEEFIHLLSAERVIEGNTLIGGAGIGPRTTQPTHATPSGTAGRPGGRSACRLMFSPAWLRGSSTPLGQTASRLYRNA